MLNFSTTGECFFSLLLTPLSLLLSLLLSELTPLLPSLLLGLSPPLLSSPPDEFDDEEESCTNLGASSLTSEEEDRFGFRPFFPFLCDEDDADDDAAAVDDDVPDLASREELAEFAAVCDFNEPLFCSVTREDEDEDSLSLEEVSGLLFSHPDDAEELAMALVGLNAGIVFTSFLF